MITLKEIKIIERIDYANSVQFVATLESDGEKMHWPYIEGAPFDGVLIDEKEWPDAAPVLLESVAKLIRALR